MIKQEPTDNGFDSMGMEIPKRPSKLGKRKSTTPAEYDKTKQVKQLTDTQAEEFFLGPLSDDDQSPASSTQNSFVRSSSLSSN